MGQNVRDGSRKTTYLCIVNVNHSLKTLLIMTTEKTPASIQNRESANEKTISIIMATQLDNASRQQEPICALFEWGPEHQDLYLHLLGKSMYGVYTPSMQQLLAPLADKIRHHTEEIRSWLEGRTDYLDVENVRFSRHEVALISENPAMTLSADTTVYLRLSEEGSIPVGPVYDTLEESIASQCVSVEFITRDSLRSAYLQSSPIQEIGNKLYLVNSAGDFEPVEIVRAVNYGALFAVCDGEKWGLVNSQGKFWLHICYDTIEAPCNGYMILRRGGKYGFLSLETGETVYPDFDDMMAIDLGEVVTVRKGAEWGYINREDQRFYSADNEDKWPEDASFFCGCEL